MKLKKKKGFTLIELLIVVAIIAILAAIAIPQFSQYRIRGYNSAALADLRNARTAEEAFFSDWQCYASTVGANMTAAAAGGGPGVGAKYSPNSVAVTVASAVIDGPANLPSADTQISFGLSQNVILSVSTSTSGGSFIAVTKNSAGNKCYGMDSDSTAIFWAEATQSIALSGGYTTVTSGAGNDLNVAGPTPCTTVWAKM